MANITNLSAVKFSNERIRSSADLLAQVYYVAVAVSDRWASLGSSQAALDQMQPDIRDVADRLLAAYAHGYWTEKNWFLSTLPSLFPNDASPVFDNGGNSQRTDVPLLTGAGVNNLVTRAMEFQNWLLSVAGSFTGTAQVETATAVGTIGTAGNATVVVTAAGMVNSPKTISVAVASADVATAWAAKVRTALAADANVNAFFTVSGAGAAIVLTARAAAANDTAMNVSLANGTNTGITAAPTSANTTAGVNPRGGVAWLNTVLQCSSYSIGTIVLSDAQNLLTRCSELRTNYQASSNVNLTTILQAAVQTTK